MKNKPFETILYSTVGLVAMAAVLIAFYYITSAFKQRVDLTQEKAYTLSAGTRAILKKLDSPVKIKFYFSQNERATPEGVYLQGYARHVEDLLDEYKQAAKGKLIIEKYSPEPDSDAEDSAHIDGVEGQMLRNGEKFYLGLAVSQNMDSREALPFLDPSRERLLEYDLSRAISRVGTPEKPVIGIMSPLPVFGMQANPMMARMGQQGQEPWMVVRELKNDFTLKQIPMDVDKIDESVKALILIHPRDITDKAQYAIDQFVLRGGKLLAFLDPTPALIDSKQENQMFSMPNTGSSLEKLLKAWGLTLESGKVVADMKFMMQVGGRGGQPQKAPGILSVTSEGINTNDVVTSMIDNVWLPYVGAFTGTPTDGLKETVLFKSTPDSQMVDGFMATMGGDNIVRDFKSSGTAQALAIRLTGKFKSAFPGGKPEDKKDEEKKDGEKKPEEKKSDDSLKEGESSVILVADADMLSDRVALQPVQTFFGTAYTPANGNLSFVQNAVEQLTGDNNLIAVRSRATLNRPFKRIRDMEAVANEKFQSEIKRLQDGAEEAQKKINELQAQKKDKDQRFILTPEQQAELTKLRTQEAETKQHLKQVQKDLRKEVVSLETTLKWTNVLAIPLAVTVSGLVIAGVKRKKTSAK